MTLAFLPPILLLFLVLMVDLFLATLGLPKFFTSLPLQVAHGCFAALILWMVDFGLRGFIRLQEQTEALRLAEDTLLREQNIELWTARQIHNELVRDKTSEILSALRHRPWHMRLRMLWQTP